MKIRSKNTNSNRKTKLDRAILERSMPSAPCIIMYFCLKLNIFANNNYFSAIQLFSRRPHPHNHMSHDLLFGKNHVFTPIGGFIFNEPWFCCIFYIKILHNFIVTQASLLFIQYFQKNVTMNLKRQYEC